MSTQMALITSCCLLLMLFGNSTSVSNRRCLPLQDGDSFCFTQPDPPVALSWYEAQRWCQNINATLPMPNTSYYMDVYANALGYFGLQTDTLWLAANATYDPKNWFWTNGSRFTGIIEDGNSPGKTHAYVIRNGTDFKIVAASPSDYNNYICHVAYSETTCAQSLSTLWINGRCLSKNLWQATWYSSVSNCWQSNIASYDDLKNSSRWLDESKKFWMGLRNAWWTWSDFVTGQSIEIIHKEEIKNLPNASNGQCLAANQTSKGPSAWVKMDCNRPLEFICQQRVGTSHKQNPYNTYSPGSYEHIYRPTRHVHHRLAIGLGVCLSGLFLIVTVCAVLAFCARRGRRDAGCSAVNLRKICEYCKPRTTSSNSCTNYSLRALSETIERHGTQYSYKPLNPAANEYVY